MLKYVMDPSCWRVHVTYCTAMHCANTMVLPTGPPENVRDHVMAATKALSSGDWAAAFGYLTALPVWGLMPKKDDVRAPEHATEHLMLHPACLSADTTAPQTANHQMDPAASFPISQSVNPHCVWTW